MDVSVIIPTRNRSALLRYTLRSVLRQQDVDLDVIIIDEGSTDDTPEMIGAFRDARIRYVRHEVPLGVSGARNRGITEARREWVAFLDDDDLWAPDKLSGQVRAAVDAGRDWVYTGSVNIAEDFRVIYGRPPLPPDQVTSAVFRYNPIPAGASNVMVRRATLLQAGPFDRRLRNTEDWDMWIRLSRIGPPAWVCHPFVAYRMHGATSSLDCAEIVRGTQEIERKHEATPDWGLLNRWLAELCLRNGRRGEALEYYVRAALRGQSRQVWSDLSGVARLALRRRVNTHITAPQPADTAWEQQARGWLEELKREPAGAASRAL